MTREQRIADGRRSTIELVDEAITNGCQDPKHRPVEEAVATLINGSFLTDVLPRKVRDAVVKFYVHDALHNPRGQGGPLAGLIGDGQPDLTKMYARLGDHDAVLLCINVATAVLRVLGRGLDDEDLDRDETSGIRLSTGVYA